MGAKIAGKAGSAKAESGKSGEPAAGERLGAQDWEEAALEALASGGLSAVSVQSLARWEESYTERVIQAIEAIADPRARLEQMLAGVTASKRAWRIHVALGAAAAQDSRVAATLARVTQRRVAYIEGCYVDLGMARRVARRRALLAYTTYVGLIHLRLEAAGTLPVGPEFRAYVEHVVETLVPR